MKKIGFIGTGNMGKAMIKGLLKIYDKENIWGADINYDNLKNTKKLFKINIANNNKELVNKTDIIILAIKPQNMDEVLNEIKNVITNKKILISIAAGISIKFIEKRLGKIPIVRVMPNTPALIGEGACAFCINKFVKNSDLKIIKFILNSFCKVSIKLTENKINSITAISGSGPAYFFYFIEAILDASLKLKIPINVAKALVYQTMIGAGKLLQFSKEEPKELRLKVTSKGGTTERAIAYFETKKLKEIIKNAIYLAKKKADELGKER